MITRRYYGDGSFSTMFDEISVNSPNNPHKFVFCFTGFGFAITVVSIPASILEVSECTIGLGSWLSLPVTQLKMKRSAKLYILIVSTRLKRFGEISVSFVG
jgi:hypothetical protein